MRPHDLDKLKQTAGDELKNQNGMMSWPTDSLVISDLAAGGDGDV